MKVTHRLYASLGLTLVLLTIVYAMTLVLVQEEKLLIERVATINRIHHILGEMETLSVNHLPMGLKSFEASWLDRYRELLDLAGNSALGINPKVLQQTLKLLYEVLEEIRARWEAPSGPIEQGDPATDNSGSPLPIDAISPSNHLRLLMLIDAEVLRMEREIDSAMQLMISNLLKVKDKQVTVLWVGFIFVLAVILAFWSPPLLHMTRIVRELSKAAEAIGRGDLSARVPVHGHDEMAEIGQTINLLANLHEEQLEERQETIEHLKIAVTRRRELSEALRVSEAMYRELFNNSPSPVCVYQRATGRIIDANRTALHQYGYAIDELQSRSIQDIWPGHVSDDRQDGTATAKGRQNRQQAKMRKKNGKTFTADVMSADVHHHDGVACIVVAHDLTEQEAIKRGIAGMNLRLSLLTQRLIEVQESEREALARELHDEIGQLGTAMMLRLKAIQTQPNQPEEIGQISEALDEMLTSIRSIAVGLRPPQLNLLGLSSALRAHVEDQARMANLEVRFDLDERQITHDKTVEITCYRVVQEAMTNVIRHSKAQRVTLELAYRHGQVELSLSDDGRGFDVEKNPNYASLLGFGITGMEERARLVGGRLNIQSRPGEGTRVTLRLPYVASHVDRFAQA